MMLLRWIHGTPVPFLYVIGGQIERPVMSVTRKFVGVPLVGVSDLSYILFQPLPVISQISVYFRKAAEAVIPRIRKRPRRAVFSFSIKLISCVLIFQPTPSGQ